jgi:argininosuccinate lyase
MSSSKLWEGLLSGEVNALMNTLNRSIGFDQRLYPYDIQASIAHVEMLGKQGIISQAEAAQIAETLGVIRQDIDDGALPIAQDVEDIHTFVEMELTRRLGDIGKKLHTGRSRNDQVTTDLRLYLDAQVQTLAHLLTQLQDALQRKAAEYPTLRMPGYTHLQRAQPVAFADHLLAYSAMLQRDRERLTESRRRILACPLGAGALAGSSFPLDRQGVAEALGFESVMINTLDAVSDRDYVIEFLSNASILMMHLSRLGEELVLWCSQEFGFVTLNDAFTTGSSMMPQKKNPDLAELVRGKTGRVYGSLIAVLTMMKALPLAYNKDMQEDKEALFDAVDTVKLCVSALIPMMETLTPNGQVMQDAIREGYLNATALANYLVEKDVPFREAYRLAGQAVQAALQQRVPLEELPIAHYQTLSTTFDHSLYKAIAL